MVNLDIDTALGILKKLGECPSTSFHENLVAECIQGILSTEYIPYEIDSYGNILARVKGTNPDNKPIAFVAHIRYEG